MIGNAQNHAVNTICVSLTTVVKLFYWPRRGRRTEEFPMNNITFTAVANQDLTASTLELDRLREVGSANFNEFERHDFRTFSYLHELSWHRLQCETTGYLFS